jgi:hypothetical protein
MQCPSGFLSDSGASKCYDKETIHRLFKPFLNNTTTTRCTPGIAALPTSNDDDGNEGKTPGAISANTLSPSTEDEGFFDTTLEGSSSIRSVALAVVVAFITILLVVGNQ